MGTFHTPTSIPPAPDEELDDPLDPDDADDADEVDEGPPDDELTPMPPVAPVSPPPEPPPPAPPKFVPPEPFVAPDVSLRGPVAEHATMTNDDRTEAVSSRLACFTTRGSAESFDLSSGCGALCHDAVRALLGWRCRAMNIMKWVIVLAMGALVTGCVPDDDNSVKGRCERRAGACHNKCYEADRGAACHSCCAKSGGACESTGDYSFYACPDKD
jgi:hypothetical protein